MGNVEFSKFQLLHNNCISSISDYYFVICSHIQTLQPGTRLSWRHPAVWELWSPSMGGLMVLPKLSAFLMPGVCQLARCLNLKNNFQTALMIQTQMFVIQISHSNRRWKPDKQGDQEGLGFVLLNKELLWQEALINIEHWPQQSSCHQSKSSDSAVFFSV